MAGAGCVVDRALHRVHRTGPVHLRWAAATRALSGDETAAFLVADEIAHHDLGHLSAPDWIPESLRERGGRIAASWYVSMAHRVHGPERDCGDDRHALEL